MTERVPFNHVRRGSGEPLVLIHGIGHHLQGWDPVAERLTGDFEVIAVDSPGFGRSQPLTTGSDIHAYTDAFASWFEQLGLDKPHVAGNSMGGGIALELARRGAVRSTTAISPVGFWSPRERRFGQLSLSALTALPPPAKGLLRRLAGNPVARTLLTIQLFSRPWRTPPDEMRAVLDDAWGSEVFPDVLAAFDAYDFARGEELDGTPVTVAWGSRDFLLLYGPQHRRAKKRLPNARHVTLTGCGHTPFFDDPTLVANVIRIGAGARA